MKKFLLIVSLLTCLTPIFAQVDSTQVLEAKQSNLEILKQDGLMIFKGVKHVYSRPLHWKTDDWFTFGGVVAGTGLIYMADEEINTYFVKQNEDIPTIVKDFGFRFGKPLVNYGFTGGVYAVGLLTKNEKVKHTGVLLLASATASGLIQTITKTATGRARPTEGEGNLSFKPFENTPGYHSFPSGHAILSITTAHAIARQIENPWIKVGIYAVGSVTPISRMWAGAHWATDIFLGGVLAVVVVDSMDKFLKNEAKNAHLKSKNAVRWQLKAGVNQIGFVGVF
jgi:membrane-associated phospholipid phosphatase